MFSTIISNVLCVDEVCLHTTDKPRENEFSHYCFVPEYETIPTIHLFLQFISRVGSDCSRFKHHYTCYLSIMSVTKRRMIYDVTL